MPNEIATLDRTAAPAIAARRAASATDAALSGGYDSFAVVSIKGRAWSIRYQGEETIIKGKDGAPLQALPVVIVGVAPNDSKTWFASGFSQDSRNPPECASADGVRPDQNSPRKQSALCADCPRNVFQSRITPEGRTTKSKECRDTRRIAVVPLGDIDNEIYGGPMLLRLPVMSIANLREYARWLKMKGASIDMIATTLKFDYSVTYPKVAFEALRWLTNEEAEKIAGPDGQSGIAADPLVQRILNQTAAPAAPVNGNDLAGGPPAVVAMRAVAAPVEPAAATIEPEILPPSRRAKTNGNGTTPSTATPIEADSDMLAAITDMLNS